MASIPHLYFTVQEEEEQEELGRALLLLHMFRSR
jgi:hypothetical protein